MAARSPPNRAWHQRVPLTHPTVTAAAAPTTGGALTSTHTTAMLQALATTIAAQQKAGTGVVPSPRTKLRGGAALPEGTTRDLVLTGGAAAMSALIAALMKPGFVTTPAGDEDDEEGAEKLSAVKLSLVALLVGTLVFYLLHSDFFRLRTRA